MALVKNGITLLSSYDPEGRCKKAAEAVSVRDRTLYFCPSPLYGYGLEKLLSRLKNETVNSAILCIELDPELFKLSQLELSQKNILGIGAENRLCLTNISNIEKLCVFVRDTWGARAFRRVEMVKLTGGWQLYPDSYASLIEALRTEIAVEWGNALTLAKLGRLYIRNFLRNLSLLCDLPSITQLSFGDSPVYVFGAGPSLDDTLNDLEKRYGAELYLPQKRSLKIVCVDTCLGLLKERNIVPDLVVILESQHWNMRDFIGCYGWEIPFAVDLCALPQSAKMLGGKGYLFTTPWTQLNLFERMKNAGLLPQIVPPLGSVGLTAMELAHRLTSGKIKYAGLDFSFTMDKYHARGAPSHRYKLNTHNRFGGLLNTAAFGAGVTKSADLYTTPNMRGYKELFEREFKNRLRTQKVCKQTVCAQKTQKEESIKVFVKNETDRLNELRDILSGQTVKDTDILKQRLNNLIRECDYLWAHFPDYSGGIQLDLNDFSYEISFLNRVRVEIEYMLKLFAFPTHP